MASLILPVAKLSLPDNLCRSGFIGGVSEGANGTDTKNQVRATHRWYRRVVLFPLFTIITGDGSAISFQTLVDRLRLIVWTGVVVAMWGVSSK